MTTTPNKRRHGRARARNVIAHLRIDGSYLPAPVEDISVGGLRIRGPEWLEVGSTLAFDLARPGMKKPLQLSGVVVDARASRGISIRFDALAPPQSERLVELIDLVGGSVEQLVVDAPRPSERELQLEAQVRAMVMEIGRAHELAQQREREVHDLRATVEQVRHGVKTDDALLRVVERLKSENIKLEARLKEERERHRAELVRLQRDAQEAMVALARLVEQISPTIDD